MIALLLFRFFKTVALLMLAAATTGAFVPESIETRQRMVYGVGTAGLALTWISGFGLLRHAGLSIGTPWIAGATLLSVGWFAIVVVAVERPPRRGPAWAAAAILVLLAALALMVVRPG